MKINYLIAVILGLLFSPHSTFGSGTPTAGAGTGDGGEAPHTHVPPTHVQYMNAIADGYAHFLTESSATPDDLARSRFHTALAEELKSTYASQVQSTTALRLAEKLVEDQKTVSSTMADHMQDLKTLQSQQASHYTHALGQALHHLYGRDTSELSTAIAAAVTRALAEARAAEGPVLSAEAQRQIDELKEVIAADQSRTQAQKEQVLDLINKLSQQRTDSELEKLADRINQAIQTSSADTATTTGAAVAQQVAAALRTLLDQLSKERYVALDKQQVDMKKREREELEDKYRLLQGLASDTDVSTISYNDLVKFVKQKEHEIEALAKAEAETTTAPQRAMAELKKKLADYAAQDALAKSTNPADQALLAQMKLAESIKAEREAQERRELARTKAQLEADHDAITKRELFGPETDRQVKLTKAKGEADVEIAKAKWNGIKEIAQNMGAGLSDPKKMSIIAATIIASAAGIYGARLGMRQLEKYLNQPKLVRETSHRGLLRGKRKVGVTFQDMILSPDLETKLRRVKESATQAFVHGTNLPNVGLFGPPGTGKTMFIKALANESGMTYAMMTGGDVSALLSSGGQNTAVTEIHKLFDWLEAHGPAVLLVDEADAFLRSGRGEGKLSEGLSAAINAFLSRTGESSDKVMIVFATNYPEMLDGAVQNRISTWIQVDRPGMTERKRLIMYSFARLAKQGLGKRHIPVRIDGSINDKTIEELAHRMDGFAGRDIKMKFIDTLEREMARLNKFDITAELAHAVLDITLKQEHDLNKWLQGVRPQFNAIG